MKTIDYDAVLRNPNVRAFAAMTNAAEGNPSYGTTFNYGNFTDFKDHPRKYTDYKGTPTSAAGGYQIVASTYDGLRKKYAGINDFSPASQDKAFVALLDDVGALQPLMNGDFDNSLKRASKLWASFPFSNSGQPRKPYSFMKRAFNTAYAQNTGDNMVGNGALLDPYSNSQRTPSVNTSSAATPANSSNAVNYTPDTVAGSNITPPIMPPNVLQNLGEADQPTQRLRDTPLNMQEPFSAFNQSNTTTRGGNVLQDYSYLSANSPQDYSYLSEDLPTDNDTGFQENAFQKATLNTIINSAKQEAIDKFTGRDPVNITPLPAQIQSAISRTIRNQLKV